jgi:RimJ/RimL family protein N-acetyltransferase
MYGPVIEGTLAKLRPPRPEDAATMITWFEDMEVTRFTLLRHPPSLDMEKEWLDRMARSPDDVVWVVEFQGQTVGITAIHMINWKNGSGTTGTVIGDKSIWEEGPRSGGDAGTGALRIYPASTAQAEVGLNRWQ